MHRLFHLFVTETKSEGFKVDVEGDTASVLECEYERLKIFDVCDECLDFVA